ncbi:MAG TPA: histidine phosphatase family protein [Acidimicrobiales bacterium]|nr:histidine phosphatase family protein [Acidimicrobiales bacterium]
MLVLIRHGEATANAEGRLVGRADVPLTERGRQQAAEVGRLLGPVVRLVSSPLRRARDTAACLDLGLPVEVDERWIEIDYGRDEGRPVADVTGEHARARRARAGFVPEGGEPLAAVARRVSGACEALFARDGEGGRDPRGDVVVVSHVSPIKAAVAWALRVDETVAWRLHLSTGSVTRIGWGPAGPVLHAYNVLPPAP